ncbi:hypothetical protein DRN97_02180 [Methanosarcinales archaeon]|nr:MAG: hypothetical protein DRN97_02180 [Methanosarcinales archaeon]
MDEERYYYVRVDPPSGNYTATWGQEAWVDTEQRIAIVHTFGSCGDRCGWHIEFCVTQSMMDADRRNRTFKWISKDRFEEIQKKYENRR